MKHPLWTALCSLPGPRVPAVSSSPAWPSSPLPAAAKGIRVVLLSPRLVWSWLTEGLLLVSSGASLLLLSGCFPCKSGFDMPCYTGPTKGTVWRNFQASRITFFQLSGVCVSVCVFDLFFFTFWVLASASPPPPAHPPYCLEKETKCRKSENWGFQKSEDMGKQLGSGET